MKPYLSKRAVLQACTAALATGLALSGCALSPPAPSSSWEKGAGAEEAAAFLKIRLPEGATEVKGAVRIQPQEKIHLLSFVTGEQAAVALTEDLRPDHPLAWSGPSSSSLSGDGFQHLGLTPPHELSSKRTTSACPPCVGDARRSHVQGIEIHLGAASENRVRVYLAAY
jgi:hypothetical protein